jgi:agmatinase
MNQHPVGQGHGEAGHYAGLPEEYNTLENAKIAIVPVAFDKTTTYQHGTEKGPESLIEASRNLELYDIETDSEVYKHGIHTSETLSPETSEEMIDVVYKTVADLIKKKKFVVTLGGEHAISFAPIKAHVEAYPNISILQFDAHADLQDAYEGNPLSHASVMARVLELPNIKNIVSVGIRSMSVEEKDNLPKTIPFFAHDLFE